MKTMIRILSASCRRAVTAEDMIKYHLMMDEQNLKHLKGSFDEMLTVRFVLNLKSENCVSANIASMTFQKLRLHVLSAQKKIQELKTERTGNENTSDKIQ